MGWLCKLKSSSRKQVPATIYIFAFISERLFALWWVGLRAQFLLPVEAILSPATALVFERLVFTLRFFVTAIE